MTQGQHYEEEKRAMNHEIVALNSHLLEAKVTIDKLSEDNVSAMCIWPLGEWGSEGLEKCLGHLRKDSVKTPLTERLKMGYREAVRPIRTDF